VFGTTLSQEYAIAASAFGLNQQQLLDLATRAVQHCFCTDEEKQQLMQHYSDFLQQQKLVDDPGVVPSDEQQQQR